MNIKVKLFIITIISVFTNVHSQGINSLWDYNSIRNNIIHDSIVTYTNIILFNGKLTTDETNGIYGYIYYENRLGSIDSSFLINTGNQIVFHSYTYNNMIKELVGSNPFPKKQQTFIKVKLYIYDNHEGIYHSYIAEFPSHWFLNIDNSPFFNTILRISSISNSDYIISISTFGYYRSIHIDSKNKSRVKKKLLKIHKKYYGIF
ncbi:MAG: hypothetical protein J6Y47_01085 [Bacteroidales bacterium]|nr:hypothetical protein [Bacteroidales bacterium]